MSDTHAASPADTPPSAQDERHTERQTLAKLVKGQRIAMLTTSASAGLLDSKPMALLEHDFEGNFWFFCHADAHDAVLREHYKVGNLAFSDEGNARYVSVSGNGELVFDRARIHALWTAAAKPWFPQGPDDPTLALLKFVPVRAEYWDGPSSRMVRLMALAASLVVGRPVGVGEHQVLSDVAPMG